MKRLYPDPAIPITLTLPAPVYKRLAKESRKIKEPKSRIATEAIKKHLKMTND